MHHVVAQGNGRGRIVLDDRDREAYLHRFQSEAAARRWVIHASCLLDTHHHAVVTTPAPDLGDGMGRILGGHAAWLNARHRLAGSVFARKFWSRRADNHFVRAAIYALVNPVAAGLVAHPRAWAWCNYRDIERFGCSPEIAEWTRDTAGFLAEIDQAAELLVRRRLTGGRAVWRAISEIQTHRQGIGGAGRLHDESQGAA